MDFESLLHRFARAVAECDVPGLTALFTPDGSYHDYFFGTHHGRDAIGTMLQRFHVGGERFAWQFLEPLANAELGYARYCFSYLSKEPESQGQVVVFEGLSRLRLSGGLIADYTEAFDRGVAFLQLGYALPRVHKLLQRYADSQRASDSVRAHLVWRERQFGRHTSE